MREHSPEYLQELVDEIKDQREAAAKANARIVSVLQRTSAALVGQMVNLATVAAHDEKGVAALEERIEELLRDPEDPDSLDAHLLNPEAQGYDLDAIRAAGVAVPSVPKEQQA